MTDYLDRKTAINPERREQAASDAADRFIDQGPHPKHEKLWRLDEARKLAEEKAEIFRDAETEAILADIDELHDKGDTTMNTRGPDIRQFDRNDAKLNQDALNHANRRQGK